MQIDPHNIPAGADLDPQIRRFIAEVQAGFARHPGFDSLPLPERRRIAEAVRAPWTRGGPRMASTENLTLATRAGEVAVRIHRPPSAESRLPALVYLHGGGWTMFSLDTHDRLMREYAARAGIAVVGIDYPLAPESRFPVALEQIRAALLVLREGGRAHGIDGARLALGGDSAGGNLTLAASLTLRDCGWRDVVRGMLLNYSVFDFEVSEKARTQYGGPGYMLGADEMDGFWRLYLSDERDARNPLACPMLAELAGLPPALLVIPECDLLTEQNLAMAERLHEAGVITDARLYRGASHSFLEAMSIADLSCRALDDTARWLRAVLHADSTDPN